MDQKEAESRIVELEKSLKEKTDYIKYLESLSEAHNNIIMLASEERIEAEKMVHAHENIHGMGKFFTESNSNEAIEHLASGLFEFKLQTSSIVERGFVLDTIVQSFKSAFKVERSILFIREKDKLASHLYSGITPDEIRKPLFGYSLQVIREVSHNKQTIVVKDKVIEAAGEKGTISIVCTPLIYKKIMVGILYGDQIK